MKRYVINKTGTLESIVKMFCKFNDAQIYMRNQFIKDKYHLDGFTFVRRRKWGYLVKNGAEYSKLHIYRINMV